MTSEDASLNMPTGGFRLLLCAAAAIGVAVGADVEYTGSKACAGCHKAIYDRYVRTRMGRSISRVAGTLPQIPAHVRDEKLNREFRVFSRDGAVFQSDAEQSNGEVVFERVWKLEYAIGSGANGMSFAVRRGDYLFQAPLSFYSKPRRWEPSPGFETTGEGFGRPLHEACIVCHSGRPQAVAGRDGLYKDPPFEEMAVGCENCHGPGALHVRQRGAGRGKLPDGSIVNPARLAPRLADDICMRCHQAGDARILLPGRNYDDFRPGQPLVRTVAIFGITDRQTEADLLEHHESMKISRCYRASSGKMQCISCHDPHQQPAADAAPAYFREKCLLCHDRHPCSLARSARANTQPADNCIGCHMIKRSVDKIAHSALTDHRIPRRPGDAPVPPDRTSAGLPGLVLLNSQPGEPLLPLITRLAAYGELMNRTPALGGTYFELLSAAKREIPEQPLVLAALGRKALMAGDTHAVDYLTQAEAAGYFTVATYLDLSRALSDAGRAEESVASLERGFTRFPYSKDIRKHLILAWIRGKVYGKAQAALEQYVSDFPEDTFMRRLLEQSKRNRPGVETR